MKNRKLSIRISEADLQTIHHKAEKANMTLRNRGCHSHRQITYPLASDYQLGQP